MDMSHLPYAKAYMQVAAGNYRMVAEGGAKADEQAASTGMIYLEILALRVLVWVNFDVFRGLAACKSVS
jgi:hypothetical protein